MSEVTGGDVWRAHNGYLAKHPNHFAAIRQGGVDPYPLGLPVRQALNEVFGLAISRECAINYWKWVCGETWNDVTLEVVNRTFPEFVRTFKEVNAK